MFIQTETTPNPDTIKFIPGKILLQEGTLSFNDKKKAKLSPLANRLFQTNGVVGVFIGKDFITVTKSVDTDWQPLKPLLLSNIMEHLLSEEPILSKENKKEIKSNKEDSKLVKDIKELLETKVRPAVAGHGGDIIFHSYNEGILTLEMQGSCSGCPSSTATLKMGVENMFRHYLPEVREVKQL